MSQNGKRRRPTTLNPRARQGRRGVMRFRARGESLRNGRGLYFRIFAPPSRVPRGGSIRPRARRAYVIDIAVADGSALRWQYSGDRDRLSGEGGELHLIRGDIPMDVDNRPHIPRQQTLTGQIARQHDAVVFFYHDASEGYAVISRGAVWSACNCQTVQIGRRPSAVSNSP